MRRLIALGMALVPLALITGCTGTEVRCDRKLQPINRPAAPVVMSSERTDIDSPARTVHRP